MTALTHSIRSGSQDHQRQRSYRGDPSALEATWRVDSLEHRRVAASVEEQATGEVDAGARGRIRGAELRERGAEREQAASDRESDGSDRIEERLTPCRCRRGHAAPNPAALACRSRRPGRRAAISSAPDHPRAERAPTLGLLGGPRPRFPAFCLLVGLD